jgi:putative transposase
MDIFSRYIVGWMVASREKGTLAKKLIKLSCSKQEIKPKQLIIHSDRGSSMTSKPVAFLLADLGVTKSLSRPYTSNDNPYFKAHFKTLKYRPEFPKRFGCFQDSRLFCYNFFNWYNSEHYHSGIGFFTPEDVHYDRTEKIIKKRQGSFK